MIAELGLNEAADARIETADRQLTRYVSFQVDSVFAELGLVTADTRTDN